MKQKLINIVVKKEFVRSAIREKADLIAFKERPSFGILFGVFLIVFSYVLAWPTISVLGSLAALYSRPLLIVVGGPLMYGLSHLVFIIGMSLAGAKYSMIVFRWAVRKAMQRLLTPQELLQVEQQLPVIEGDSVEEQQESTP